jgi:hypothetical protein
MENRISKLLLGWVGIASGALCYMILSSPEKSKFFQAGPNPDFYIIGIHINTFPKYSAITAFCLINSIVRTFNNELLKPFIINKIQDKSKPLDIAAYNTYEITTVSCLYVWFDFFMYINVSLSQIDMFLIETIADLIITGVLTTYYIRVNRGELSTYNLVVQDVAI